MNRAAVREVADLYFERFDARLSKGLTEIRAEMDVRLERLEVRLADQGADLIKWMFVFWIGTIVPLAGLLVALTKL